MNAPLAKLIDWSALQFKAMRLPHLDGRAPKLEEALHFLKGPGFIPAETKPAELVFDDSSHFSFSTPRPSDIAESNTVYGRFYRCAQHWQRRPVIILLQGNDGFFSHQISFPIIARRCNRTGFNVATLVAPNHCQRRSRQPAPSSHPDYLRLAKAIAQAVAEIRALTGWLLAEGCPAVALWGNSLGGWLAGMTVCHDTRLAAAVLTVPGVQINYSFAERIFFRGTREALQKQRVPAEMLNLTTLKLAVAQPVIPKENVLLMEASHDLFVPKEQIEELWQAWRHPEIWRLPHGHISESFAVGLTDRVLH